LFRDASGKRSSRSCAHAVEATFAFEALEPGRAGTMATIDIGGCLELLGCA
jgi:hypothetical protein